MDLGYSTSNFMVPIILNDDGEFPLVNGTPFPKKKGYVMTRDKSIWSVSL